MHCFFGLIPPRLAQGPVRPRIDWVFFVSSAWIFLFGVLLTTAAGAVSVPLVAAYGPADLAWLRFLSTLLIFPAILRFRPQSFVRPTARQVTGLSLLGLASLLGLFLMLYALQGLALATTTGIFFCYPFLAVAMAALFLREQIGLLVWTLTALGLMGVFLLFDPQAAGLSLFSLAALGSGVAVAVRMLLTRALGLGLPPLTTAAGEALVAVVLLTPFLSLGPLLSGQMLGHLVLYLALANGSRIAIVFALSKADLAALAPLGYSEVVFAAALQWVALGQPISPFEAAAFTAILAAGLGVAQIRCRPVAERSGPGQPGR